jgi:ketosteroid isomerase-like protein
VASTAASIEFNWGHQVEYYVAQGDKVFVYGNYSAIYKATGRPMNARGAHLWTLADGKVTHFEQFVDSHTVQLAITDQ